MSSEYNFTKIEKKWQDRWTKEKLYKAPAKPINNNKFYMLEMFAYPSGDMHMGHFRNYAIGDAVARYQMMNGKSLLHPYGWDAFGLPAERAAIQRGIHPAVWTKSNISVSGETLRKTGVSYDWSREISSADPEYYKFTQWMFIKLFEKGLAYRKRGFVNWCPEDKTVLANEQVKEGACERCGTPVEKKDQVQWYFKITDYADRLIDDLDKLPNWPENVKTIQREWIGRSHGLEVDFTIEESGKKLPIFTTRPDTIFGVTFMAISPESEILDDLSMDREHSNKVTEYKKRIAGKTDIERSAMSGDKDGVFTGKYAINPFNGEKVQLWVADYVLAGYGTGAVMAVPGHDSRDFAFAKRYGIPIRIVIQPEGESQLNPDLMEDAYTEIAPMTNSEQFDGQSGDEAFEALAKFVESKGIGRRKVNYRLKDWSISRQRYWGCPIPIIHCDKCGEVPVDVKDLPVELPIVEDYKPKGRSPLADVSEFIKASCPKCGGEASRDSDTMDTFVCSSWYFLRYIDPHNDHEPFSRDLANAWMPIDMYIGGITHATGHLIYFRFFTKFLHDIGWLNCEEPALYLFNHGMVSDSSGEVMSKSKGNVVSPIDLMNNRGVDVTRLAMFFAAPSEKPVLWSNDSLTGVEKFIHGRLYNLSEHLRLKNQDLKQCFKQSELPKDDYALYVKLNQTIKRTNEGFERLQFNTVISALMELLRDYYANEPENDNLNDLVLISAIKLIAPLAPHLADELWEKAGYKESVFKSIWPVYDPDAIVGELIGIAIQINGKLRDTIQVAPEITEDQIINKALESQRIKNYLVDKELIRKIYVPGRLVNLVVKG